jgi:hypothetical protein
MLDLSNSRLGEAGGVTQAGALPLCPLLKGLDLGSNVRACSMFGLRGGETYKGDLLTGCHVGCALAAFQRL